MQLLFKKPNDSLKTIRIDGRFKIYFDYIATIMEAIGVLTNFVGSLFIIFRFIYSLKSINPVIYIILRQGAVKSIFLGLEILIATDIMATIRTKPSLKSVSILGIIVIIRTFLSLSLQWSYKKNYVGKNLRKRMMSTAYPYKI